MLTANGFELSYLVEALLQTSLKEFTYGENDINLGCSCLESECRLCYFDLRESLCSGETGTAASDIEFRILERFAGIFRHGGIDADSSYVRHARIVLVKLIYCFCHAFYFSDGIIRAKSGQVDLV